MMIKSVLGVVAPNSWVTQPMEDLIVAQGMHAWSLKCGVNTKTSKSSRFIQRGSSFIHIKTIDLIFDPRDLIL